MIVALGDRDTRYLTHREIDAALALFPAEVRTQWVATGSPDARSLDEANGVWLLPGTPYRDAEAAFAAIRHCLATGTPFLGTCGGFQHALVELARSRAGLSNAAFEESDPDAVDPIRSSVALAAASSAR
jgi:CTP synthase (UTP-ammonia lyase)